MSHANDAHRGSVPNGSGHDSDAQRCVPLVPHYPCHELRRNQRPRGNFHERLSLSPWSTSHKGVRRCVSTVDGGTARQSFRLWTPGLPLAARHRSCPVDAIMRPWNAIDQLGVLDRVTSWSDPLGLGPTGHRSAPAHSAVLPPTRRPSDRESIVTLQDNDEAGEATRVRLAARSPPGPALHHPRGPSCSAFVRSPPARQFSCAGWCEGCCCASASLTKGVHGARAGPLIRDVEGMAPKGRAC